MSTLVFYLLFNHLKTSTKKMDSNVLSWDIQCVPKFECIFFVGDTKGNNKWLGQYPGNREGVRRPYCDCKCQFQDLSNPDSNCIYLTMADINYTQKSNQEDEDAGIEYYHSISVYDIRFFHYLTIYMDRTK